MGSRLLTARQVADLLGVSSETVLRWTRRGLLPAIRLPGGAIRYRESDLEAWLQERETAAPVREAPATLADAGRLPVPVDLHGLGARRGHVDGGAVLLGRPVPDVFRGLGE